MYIIKFSFMISLFDNVKKLHYNFTDAEQLWLTVKEIWKNIDSDTIKKLFDSMPNKF